MRTIYCTLTTNVKQEDANTVETLVTMYQAIVYSKINSAESPASGAGHVSDLRLMIIIIIIIYCDCVVTRWQWLFYMYTKHEIGYY